MIRQLAGAMALAVALVVGGDRAGSRPGPERHAGLRRRIARRADARSDPRRPAGQRRLPGGDVRLAGRLRSREGRRRPRRRRDAGNCRADGLTWTFSPAPGQKFHNGDKLTAHDVKFSLERQMGPDSLASAAATLQRTIKSIEVVDDLTVKVNTNSPQIGLPASAVAAPWRPKARSCRRSTSRRSARRSSARSRSAAARGSSCATCRAIASSSRPSTTPHWRGTPHFKDLHDPAGAGGEHARRDGAHRRGGDRLDRTRRPCAARTRAGLEVLSVPGTMQAIFQFWGTYRPEREGLPDRQAAGAPGAVAGDRPQADHRARHERQGAACRIRSRPSATPTTSAPTLGEMGGRGLSLRSGAGEEDPGRGGLSRTASS